MGFWCHSKNQNKMFLLTETEKSWSSFVTNYHTRLSTSVSSDCNLKIVSLTFLFPKWAKADHELFPFEELVDFFLLVL